MAALGKTSNVKVNLLALDGFAPSVAQQPADHASVVCGGRQEQVLAAADDDHLERCLRSALESGKPHEENS